MFFQFAATCKAKAIGSVEYDELFLQANKYVGSKFLPKIQLLLLRPFGIAYSLRSDKDLLLKLV
jgi:hypothetical protein